MKQTNAFQFFNKNYSVKEYSDMYKKLRLDIRYPANVKREQIFVKLLKKHKPKKIIDAALKKAAANAITGGNAAPGGGVAGAAQKASGAIGGALDAMAKGAGVKGVDKKDTGAGGSAGATADPKVAQLKNKGGISPDIQAMIDKLTPTEKKALAGAI